MRLNILIVYTTPRTKEQKLSLDKIKRVMRKYDIKFNLANRNSLKKPQFRNKDLIIAVGGDGTFLRAAHFINKQAIFGVNSDVKDKEGFFMKSNKRDFERKFGKILRGKIKPTKLQRLEARINNKKTEVLALNEFFIGPRKSYHAAKYVIKVGNRRERQKSSGVLAATPAGSNSWAKSSCGRTLPLSSNSLT